MTSLDIRSSSCSLGSLLPDIEWTDMSQFLESYSKSNKNLTIIKSLAKILGINVNKCTEVSK